MKIQNYSLKKKIIRHPLLEPNHEWSHLGKDTFALHDCQIG
jgi:hypothetical protein